MANQLSHGAFPSSPSFASATDDATQNAKEGTAIASYALGADVAA